MINLSIVPPKLREKDPRRLAKLFPNMIRNNNQNFISFIKKLQKYEFYRGVLAFEEYAHNNGFILLPASITHWKRRQKFGIERRVVVARKSFYLVREYELTEGEKRKLIDYIECVRREKL